MAVNPPAPGIASGPPAPPLDPHALNALLARDPARAAILAAMRPALRARQAQAHADLAGVDPASITQEWADLIARCAPLLTPPARPDDVDALCASVYDPEMLSDLLALHPRFAHELLSRLSAAQRVAQAVAYAAWMASHGVSVDIDEVLMGWKEASIRAAA